MLRLNFLVLAGVIFWLHTFVHCTQNLTKIAIIGGGVGGTSAAYFLSELFGPDGAHIDLYEYNKIGGRLSTVEINNEDYEAGGSIIHHRNKYMVEFSKNFGLQKRKDRKSRFGLYDGNDFLFIESRWGLVNLAKLAWRYGYGPIKLQDYVDDLLTKFERIYALQDKGATYSTVSDLLDAMSGQFVNDLKTSTKEGFKENGFSDLIIDELIMATLTTNYGQGLDVHEFVGSVSVAGGGELWSVQGGNRLVPQELLKASKATMIQSFVSKVHFVNESQGFIVESSDSRIDPDSKADFKTVSYDIVIIAAPFTQDTRKGIELVNFPSSVYIPGNYHRTVCTFVNGKINYKKFGFDSEDDMIDCVLTTKLGLPFTSIARIYPVNDVENIKGNKSKVWKIFSQKPLAEEQIDDLFLERKEVKVIDWLAYPQYHSDPRTDRFILFDNLYHVNAIEWAASAMEMSVVGAKNVALLVYNSWHKVNTTTEESLLHEEL